jgi:hypothetical protein
MIKFMVHTDVLAKELGPFGFTSSVSKMLSDARLSNVVFKQAYVCPLAICHCVKDRKVICEFDSADEDTVRSALAKIGLPANAILAKPN